MKTWKKIFYASENQESKDILISGKIDVKPKMVTRDKQGHYSMIKGEFIKKILQS